jgi:Bacterial SH3 domain
VLPLLAGEQALGALLFLSARPSAFVPASLPLAQAAASQVVFAINSTYHDQLWRQQVQAIEQWIAEAGPVVNEPVPAADLTIQPPSRAPDQPAPGRPAPAPVTAVPIAAPARPAAAEPVAPPSPSTWRRWALPAGALLLVLCLAGTAIANRGALQQAAAGLLGGAAAPTPTITVVATQPSPLAPTLAPTIITAAPATPQIPTQVPVIATETPLATLTPAPTATELPTASPTVALPPDVIGLATVVLPQGIVGRLRDAPNGNVIGGVPGNTLVQVLAGRQTTPDNIVWVHIRLPSGQTGWFSEGLLKYTATPVP